MKKVCLIILGIGFIIIPYVKVVGPLSLFCIVILSGATLYLIRKLVSNDNKILWQLFVVLNCLLFVGLLEIVYGNFDTFRFMKTIVFPATIICGLLYYVRSRKLLDFFLQTILTLVAFSALVAVLQAFGIDLAWELRLALGVPEPKVLQAQIIGHTKPSGLAYFSVQLGYQIIMTFPFVYYLRSKGSKINQGFITLLGGCIFAGALATESVSAILVIIITHFFYLRRIGGKQKKLFIFLCCMIVLILVKLPVFDRILHPDTSMLSRIAFSLTGITILFTHPFGVASSELYNLKMQWLNNTTLAALPGSDWILWNSFHNSFINVGMRYGVIAILVYIGIYLYLFKIIKKDLRSNQYLQSNARMFYFSLTASVLGYLFNSSVHNAGLPSGDLFGWALVGLVIVNKSILVKQKQRNIELNKRGVKSEVISI